jgi:hypothetical protein
VAGAHRPRGQRVLRTQLSHPIAESLPPHAETRRRRGRRAPSVVTSRSSRADRKW